MFTIKKENVIKVVNSELELGMYLSAGWKKVEEKPKKEVKKEVKNND